MKFFVPNLVFAIDGSFLETKKPFGHGSVNEKNFDFIEVTIMLLSYKLSL